jgi:hypothetical protein
MFHFPSPVRHSQPSIGGSEQSTVDTGLPLRSGSPAATTNRRILVTCWEKNMYNFMGISFSRFLWGVYFPKTGFSNIIGTRYPLG